MDKEVVKPQECPFCIVVFPDDYRYGYRRGWRLCGIRKYFDSHRGCDYDSWEWLEKCRFVEILKKAFDNRDYAVIHHLSSKVSNREEWEKLVWYLSGVRWKTWQLHIGDWLTKKCRKEPACPYKALLPESR